MALKAITIVIVSLEPYYDKTWPSREHRSRMSLKVVWDHYVGHFVLTIGKLV